MTFCALLDKIASRYVGTGLPITLVLDNARYQKCRSVFERAEELGIELLYLPGQADFGVTNPQPYDYQISSGILRTVSFSVLHQVVGSVKML